METKIAQYLEKVVEKSNDKASVKFAFDQFDRVNIYLIRQVLNKQKHLWLKPCDSKITKFYQSMLFAVAIEFFEKNFCESKKDQPKIGDRYQEKKERFEVIEVDIKLEDIESIKLKYINKKDSKRTRTIPISTLINNCTKLDKRTGITNRDTFRPMLDFIEKTLGERENIPSFPHKFAVIAQKNHFESCFSQLDKRAFPYTYISNDGSKTKNIPSSEPMLFVASHYETIQQYIFDKNIRLDTIIFMDNRYDDQLQQDIDRGYFQQGIFIGKQEPTNMQRLLKWCWTLPECRYFDDLPQGKIDPVKIDNEVLSQKITQFITRIEQLERKHYINLKKLHPYISYIFPLIMLSKDSRLKNRISDLSHSFQRKLEKVLGEEFSNTGSDYKEINDILIDNYRIILEQVYFEKNAKTQKLQETKATPYLLMPERQTLHIWQIEIKNINWSNAEVISFSKFKQLEKPSSVTILSLTDYDFYCAIRNSQHHVKWLLYDCEYKRYQNFSTRYDNKLIEEYQSSNRKKLIGIDYPDEIQSETPETIDEVIDKFFDNETDKSEYEINYQDHIEKKITFTNDESINLSANSTVILIDQHNKEIKYKVNDLTACDKVKIYKNQHKEVLFDITARQGKFKEILDNSKLCKDKLAQYCIDNEKIAKIASKCNVAINTVNSWLCDHSKTKFPKNIEPLKDILDNDYQKILKSKQNYNSIMIALGRDLSDEISDYIIFGSKGKILEKFDDDSIKAISSHNMPVRTIKQIEII